MKTKTVIFARCSSSKQEYLRQLTDLNLIATKNDYVIVKTYKEKISGSARHEDRKALVDLMADARRGLFDKVLVSEVTRIGRTTEVIRVIEELTKLGISVYIADMGMETLNPDGTTSFISEMLIHILTLCGKQEKTVLISRIKSGLKQERLNGVRLGRPTGTAETEKDFLNKYSKVVKDIELGLSVRKVCKIHDIAQNTVQKIKRTLEKTQIKIAA